MVVKRESVVADWLEQARVVAHMEMTLVLPQADKER